jgi:tetratricopeptide (TPR) repeat protein
MVRAAASAASSLLAAVAVVAAVPAVARAAEPRADSLGRAELLLDAASLSRDTGERYRLADEAAALCERAAAQKPKDPEPVMMLIRALTVGDVEHPELCRPGHCEAALAAIERVRKMDSLALESARVAAEEGILLSRMGRFAQAMVAYERALPLVEASRRPNGLDERPGSVLLWGNSAETAMALGRLDDAIRRYEIAVDNAPYGDVEWQLALYGLAVALDRDGQVERARHTIQRVLERDPSLSRLHDEGVFFAPAGDLYYYEGLGHEVAGDRTRARAAFARFVQAQPHSRWIVRARAHLALLGTRAEPGPIGEVHVGRPLSEQPRRAPELVRAGVAAHAGELRVCYERHLRAHPGQPIALQLALEIGTMGGARGRVLTSSDSALELSRCVELSADGWRFGPLPPGEAEMLLVPLDFTPARSLRTEDR